MQIFYITFCWNRRLFYDGYLIKQDNKKIIGCTDEFIIVGDEKGFEEMTENTTFIYPISENFFYKYESLDGFRVTLNINKEEVKISIRKENKITSENVLTRINKVLKNYPAKTQKLLIESYLEEE